MSDTCREAFDKLVVSKRWILTEEEWEYHYQLFESGWNSRPIQDEGVQEAVEAFRITRAELHSLAAQTIGQFIAYQKERLTFVSGDVVESWLTHRKEESKGDRSL